LVPQFGFDFTVHGNSINVSSVLVFTSSANDTLSTSKNVAIFDRATDTALVRVGFSAGQRTNQNDFVSRPVSVVLPPGVYSILANWTAGADLCARGLPGTDETVVRTTAAVTGLVTSATRQGETRFTSPTDLLGVTFAFSVIANQAPPPLAVATEFVDCEAVACAGLPTGEYSVGGKRTFCDNDEAGGGWTRIWRVNDSSCEEHGWTSERNGFVNGTDPVGCRRGSASCTQSKDITSTNHAEVMGKNWEIWAYKSPDSFANGDGVFVIAGTERLWTFSVSSPVALPQFRCPCDSRFSTNETAILRRINDTGEDYICDAVTDAFYTFSPVFRAGPILCSPTGGPVRRFFQKVLTEQQKQSPLRVAICKDQGDNDEDVKLAALDLFVRDTPGFDRALHCPLTMPPTTSRTSQTTSTSATISLLSATGETAFSSTTAVVQPFATSDSADTNIAVIAGAVGGSIGVVLIAAAIFFRVKHSRVHRKTASSANNVANRGTDNYGQLPVATYVVLPTTSQKKHDYAVGNIA
jgi:hypothetical protein